MGNKDKMRTEQMEESPTLSMSCYWTRTECKTGHAHV